MRVLVYAVTVAAYCALSVDAFVPLMPARIAQRASPTPTLSRFGATVAARRSALRMSYTSGPDDEDDMVMRRVDAILDVTPMQLVFAYFEHAYEGEHAGIPANQLEASFAADAVERPSLPDLLQTSSDPVDADCDQNIIVTNSERSDHEDAAHVLCRVSAMTNDARVNSMKAEQQKEQQRFVTAFQVMKASRDEK